MSQRLFQILVGSHIAILSLGIIWAIIGAWLAEKRWQTVAKPIEQDLVETFSPRTADTSTIHLQRLTSNIGLSLADNTTDTTDSPTAISNTAEPAQVHKVHDCSVSSAVNSRTGGLVPFDEPLKSYVIQNQENIAQLANHLVNHPPRWQRPHLADFLQSPDSLLSQGPLNYSQIKFLHCVLLVTGLDYARQNQPQLTNQNLIAAWNLMHSLSEQPLGWSYSMLNEQAEALRFSPVDVTVWKKHWADVNPLKLDQTLTAWPLIQAKKMKMAMNCQSVEKSSAAWCVHVQYSSGARQLLYPFIKPYFTFAAIDFLQQPLQHLDSPDPCIPPAGVLSPIREFEHNPKLLWNRAYALYAGTQWQTMKESLVEWELTNKVLQVRSLREQLKKTPTKIPDFEKSSVCPSLTWQYEVVREDKINVSFEDDTGQQLLRPNPTLVLLN